MAAETVFEQLDEDGIAVLLDAEPPVETTDTSFRRSQSAPPPRSSSKGSCRSWDHATV
jgi:hypothetical protein